MKTQTYPTAPKQRHRRPVGFTLVEIVLGIALMALLFGGIFAVARGSLQIASEVTQNQQYSMRIHSYLELLRRTFEDMPGNAKVQLTPLSGRGVESDVAFVEYPLAFAWSGVPAGSPVTVFRTTRGPEGWLQSRIYYLEEEMADRYLDSGDIDSAAPNLLIMDEIKMLQWRFYDQRADEWLTEWEIAGNNQRPSLIELNIEFLDGSNPFAVIYWIPTVVNPEQVARSLNTTNRNQAGGGGAAAGGGDRGGRGRGGDAEGGRGGRGRGGDAGRGGGGRGGNPPGGRGGTGGGRPAGGGGGARPGGGGR